MNESERQQNVWPTESQPHGATPADALHTLLEFVIDNRETFRTWLNQRLEDNGSKLVLQMHDINEALVDLDDLLHVAMDRPRRNVKRVQVSPDVLKMVMERMASLTDEDVYGNTECPLSKTFPHHIPGKLEGCTCQDPDANTGQYL